MASLAIADLAKADPTCRKRRSLKAATLLLGAFLLAAGLSLYGAIKPSSPKRPALASPPASLATDDRNAVRLLQEMLSLNGFYAGKPDGKFDARTEEGVRRFQESEHLTVDGRPGGQTLLRLYKRAGGIFAAATSLQSVSTQPR